MSDRQHFSPEAALAVLCQSIGTERWPGLLDLMQTILAKDGKMIVEKALTAKNFAAIMDVSIQKARYEFQKKPTFTVGKERRMSYTTLRKEYFDRAV